MDSAEAIGYALAVTPFKAYYDLSSHWGISCLRDTIEDTYVRETPNGYSVHLFHEKYFGCGPHWTSSVDIELSKDGLMAESSRNEIYRDRSEDHLCRD